MCNIPRVASLSSDVKKADARLRELKHDFPSFASLHTQHIPPCLLVNCLLLSIEAFYVQLAITNT